MYGPLVTGYSVTISSKRRAVPSVPAPQRRENTRMVPTANTASAVRSFRSKRMVRASSTVARSTTA